MKTVRHLKFWPMALLLLLSLTFGSVLRTVAVAQEAESKPEAPPAPPSADPAPADATVAVPSAPVPADQVPAPASSAAAPAAPEGEMRELVPAAETVVAEEAVTENQVETAEPAADRSEERRERSRHNRSNERVSVGGNSTLADGESAQAVISIIGSSTSAGTVHEAVVSILGGSRVTGGTVGDVVVSVLGNTYVNGEVKGEVVTVLGNVELGPKAKVHGEVVCVGGQLQRHPDAVVLGQVQNIAFAGGHFDFGKIGAWFTECLLKGRMLAFDSRLTWAWTIALVALGFYALVALIAPTGVNKCVETLEQRPGSSLLAALLTLLLTPVAYILLAVTIAIVVGIILIPFFTLGLFFASLFGKIVMLAWLGRRFTRLLGDSPLAHPFFGVLIGGVVILALYATPYVGIVTHKLIGILGLGVVVYTLILGAKANRPPKPAPAAGVPPPAAGFATPAAPATDVSAAGGATSAAYAAATPVAVPLVSAAPPVISAVTLPRAGFWIRVAAAFLDVILVAIVFGLLEGMLGRLVHFGGSFPLWYAVYHVAMWATKGTTIGGIICGLKVVRLDDRPLDWTVAVVRALSAFLSLAVAGLGFIWVAFDDEKQSWHDKIAGTTIVKVPKGTALL
jgi:uncharacterized RDD family membrane protein YckC/cytoskeletal protein CcmA (bactofilin family)